MTDDVAFKKSPLDALKERLAVFSVGGGNGVTLIEVPFQAQINVRGDAEDPVFRAGVRSALDLDLPSRPNTVVTAQSLSMLWLGPDEWLVVGPEDTEADRAAALRTTLAGQHVSVVDVSANRTVLELAGPKAREVLMKGCALDFHPRRFAAGQCAQSILARVPVIIEQRNDMPTYRLFARNSFAIHLASWLMDAMGEYRD